MSDDLTRDFPDGTALVIGGSGGIGRAICAGLARRGADVALTYRKGRDAAEAAAEVVRELGRAAETHALALDDAAATQRLLDDLAARRGPIHSIVHAAGADIPMQYISEVTPEKWGEVMRGDADGFFHLVHAALPHLRRARGSLTVITSAGLRRHPTRDILSVAPKAAIEALMRGVAREEGRYGVRANAVALGVIEAGIFLRLEGKDFSPDWVEAARKNTALGRFGSADEVAEVTTFLASARASYVTGQTLVLDGGYSL